jgi:predicted nucleic acid-binding protein
VTSVILDTGPCLNFLAVNEGKLLYSVLGASNNRILVPQEVANEIVDKARESAKFSAAARRFEGLSREPKFAVLESKLDDVALIRAMRRVSPGKPPSELLAARRMKDLGEILVISHAIKLRDEGNTVSLVMDERIGRKLAIRHGFKPISTPRIMATAGSMGLLSYSDSRLIYEKLRASDGSRVMDDGLPHWKDSKLDDRSLYKQDREVLDAET